MKYEAIIRQYEVFGVSDWEQYHGLYGAPRIYAELCVVLGGIVWLT